MQELIDILLGIMEADADRDYATRNRLTLNAMATAANIGFPTGIRIDPDEPAWPVAYIELPTGQVGWHMPQHPTPWDGHDTAEKYRRIRELEDYGPQAEVNEADAAYLTRGC